MAFKWNAEKIVSPEMALELIQTQFPELNIQTITLLGEGWDNTAYMINKDLIFRFPRRSISVSLIESEWEFLPKLAALIDVPMPTPKWKGMPSELFPWPFIGYRKVPGTTACQIALNDTQRASLSSFIGDFLRALHSVDIREFTHIKVYGDSYGRINGTELTLRIESQIEDLFNLGLLKDRKKLEFAVANSANYSAPNLCAVVHGDFYARHILLNGDCGFAGVIDWGDVHIGDPAIDLSIAHSFLPKSAHDSFRKAYGDISEGVWQLARLRSIFSISCFLIYAHHSGDEALKREGLSSIDRICET